MKRVTCRGFSLVEVVLALGVIAFAIVGIMGLFPVAMRAAQESQRETRATLIARQILTDLESSPPGSVLIAVSTNISSPSAFLSPPPTLSSPWSNTIRYDNDGLPLGVGTNDAAFLASISCQPNNPFPGLARVQVDISAPGQAPPSSRTTNTFVTLLRQE